jgi:hypothetical protein
MPFTNPSFPGQVFRTFKEYEEAKRIRKRVEGNIVEKEGEITKVTATVIPAPKNVVERRVVALEKKMDKILEAIRRSSTPKKPTHNKEGLTAGTILRGESRGREYTLEILEEGYLCSDGNIYPSLSGAALGVSDNRRSGWKFWKDVEGTPIGEVTGRFKKNASSNPFDS